MIVSIRPVLSFLFYRRPDFVPTPPREPSIMESDSSIKTRTSDVSVRGIPERLSFDKILNHETCPPCTTLDFYNYLNNKAHCAETLQFFLWLRDYTHRFHTSTQSNDTSTMKIWTHDQQEEALQKFQKRIVDPSKKIFMSANVKEIFKDSDFSDEPRSRNRGDSAVAPPQTGSTGDESTLVIPMVAPWESQEQLISENKNYSNASIDMQSQESRDSAIARAGYVKFGLHYPFFLPPFRREMESIIATYFVEGGSRQLNLSAKERFAILSALQVTAHPSAFLFVSKNVEESLRHQHHPNFIIDAICNGNRPRVVFARGLGAALTTLGMVAAIILTLSAKPRGFRAFAAIFWTLGISTSIAAWKGMCVVLHGLHHRHVRPWELFQANGDLGRDDPLAPDGTASNDITTEYWTERYAKRNIVRKIFDREVWVQEPALRQIQDAIFVQAMLIALAISGVLTIIFVVGIPRVNTL